MLSDNRPGYQTASMVTGLQTDMAGTLSASFAGLQAFKPGAGQPGQRVDA